MIDTESHYIVWCRRLCLLQHPYGGGGSATQPPPRKTKNPPWSLSDALSCVTTWRFFFQGDSFSRAEVGWLAGGTAPASDSIVTDSVSYLHFTPQFPWYLSCPPQLLGPRIWVFGGFHATISTYLETKQWEESNDAEIVICLVDIFQKII